MTLKPESQPCDEHSSAHEALPASVRSGVFVRADSSRLLNRDPRSAAELAAACCRGDRTAAARLISRLESSDAAEAAESSAVVSAFPPPKNVVGVTGPPGAGKSTLIDYLLEFSLAAGERPAVLAVDPSSPFTGGALLGDRLRMARHGGNVFIRSMGTRGAGDGLASAAGDALRVFAAGGFDPVFLETVGVGQSETEVISLADTVVVLQVPGLGDDIQLLKQGLLEIADIFVVHQCDRPEAEELLERINDLLRRLPAGACRTQRQLGPEFAAAGNTWKPSAIAVSSLAHRGGETLFAALLAHRKYLAQPNLAEAMRRDRLRRDLIRRATLTLQARLRAALRRSDPSNALLEDCLLHRCTLTAAVERLIDGVCGRAT